MSDWLIDYMIGELRKRPHDIALKRIIAFRRRKVGAIGKRFQPSTETIGKARRIIFDGGLLPGQHIFPLRNPLPIDLQVRRIIQSRHFRIEDVDEAKSPNSSLRISSAYWEGRMAVIDGCTWGDYYVNLKRVVESNRRALAALALEDGRHLRQLLDEYLKNHILTIGGFMFRVGYDAQKAMQDLRAAEDALSLVNSELDQLPVDRGGNPGDPWRVGFVYGMALHWVDLTNLKIADSDIFLDFVSSGAETVRYAGDGGGDRWSSAIRTAVRTFGLAEDGRSWLTRPGDPPPTTEPSP